MTHAKSWLRCAVLGVVLASGVAAAQRAPFKWEVPGVVGVVDVSAPVIASGIPVKMTAVRSKERPEVILRSLVDRFLVWGLHVPAASLQPQLLREPMITALDTREFISYTAIVQPNPDGTTTVFLGQADLSKAPRVQSSVAPVYPGGSGLLQSEMEGARTLVYSASARALDVEVYYRNELSQAGFEEVEPMLFRSTQDELHVRVTPAKEGKVSVVVVRRGVAPEEAPKPAGD
ncbi:hypothetical protein SAMN05443572_101244 [Myxococcus fulvus]|uniref:Uncharacterized protein n=1 Tax=Myxococcus fulvus TaxID=33 RepID=A0A511T0P3_MYXFU|nr:hypothetical protein [Myxococcus fulvus]GEN07731.1 hypothetical protein MFU01_27680 [Myxococcus fulvus]SES81608.1 hypothetical protein SAMN05443572_101244 [Myxococcus fulvus]